MVQHRVVKDDHTGFGNCTFVNGGMQMIVANVIQVDIRATRRDLDPAVASQAAQQGRRVIGFACLDEVGDY